MLPSEPAHRQHRNSILFKNHMDVEKQEFHVEMIRYTHYSLSANRWGTLTDGIVLSLEIIMQK